MAGTALPQDPHQIASTVHARGTRFRRRLARVVTEILAPAPTVATLLLVVSWYSAATVGERLKWAAPAILFSSVVPILYIIRGVRRRQLTDHHVRLREQRGRPLLFAVASVLVGLALLAAAGAPRDIVALVGAGAVGLAVAIAITLVWKISIHTAVSAGSVAVLVVVFGPALLIFAPLVVLSGWARVELGDHTVAQAGAGGAVGAAVALLTFPLFRSLA